MKRIAELEAEVERLTASVERAHTAKTIAENDELKALAEVDELRADCTGLKKQFTEALQDRTRLARELAAAQEREAKLRKVIEDRPHDIDCPWRGPSPQCNCWKRTALRNQP